MIDRAEHVVADDKDELGMLAALAGVPVSPASEETQPRSQTDAKAELRRLICDVEYFDPYSGATIPVERWIEILGDWRRLIDTNRPIRHVWGMAGWKRPALKTFLWNGSSPRFVRPGWRTVQRGDGIAVWPSRIASQRVAEAEAAGASILRVEDGFIRSLGLGCHLHPPASVTVDARGIHYDPSRPSTLEDLLLESDFDPALIARAARLIEQIVGNGITKYAAGASKALALPRDRRVVLVAGQVEDDLSVRLGGGDIATNLDLLTRARAAEPDAFLIYKPHPDVTSGLRTGAISDESILRFADLTLRGVDAATLLSAVDAVHVRTSLIGFEALLRRRRVVTHGQPFYSGWGLTTDLAPAIARRGRMLSLEELVAAALILYPRYLDPLTRLPCPPEVLVERHARAEPIRSTRVQRLRAWQGQLLNRWQAVAGAAA